MWRQATASARVDWIHCRNYALLEWDGDLGVIKLDLHTKSIDSTTRIFVCRPGPNYRDYTLFVESQFVGPDLPQLDLPEFDNFEDIPFLAERIKRSIELRRHALRAAEDAAWPSGDLETYSDEPDNRSYAQFLRMARAYFAQIKAGDLIIVSPQPFRALAHIGEVVSAPNELKLIYPAVYFGMPLTGRHVAWKSVIEKAKLPAQTLDALQKPASLFLLPQPAWPAIFRRAYGSYSMAGEYGARFEVTSEGYQTSDDFLIQAFFNFVSENTERVLAGSDDLVDFKTGAFLAMDGRTPDLYTNVNSPGGLSLKSVVITPIVIAAMYALAVYVGPDAYAQAVENTIIIGNSLGGPDDPCSVPVREQVVTQIRLLGFDRWAEACEMARRTADNTGLSTTATVQAQ